jgi:hypothetical protein
MEASARGEQYRQLARLTCELLEYESSIPNPRGMCILTSQTPGAPRVPRYIGFPALQSHERWGLCCYGSDALCPGYISHGR